MPSHEEHCRQSFERYGKRFDELHTWMDEPSAVMGPSHRMHRHDPYRTPKEALERFGHMADHACLDHIKLDKEESAQKGISIRRAKAPQISSSVVSGFWSLISLLLGIYVFSSHPSFAWGGVLFFLISFLGFLNFLSSFSGTNEKTLSSLETNEKKNVKEDAVSQYIAGDLDKIGRFDITIMVFCAECGEEFDSKLKICPKCGWDLISAKNKQKEGKQANDSKSKESMTCLHCGLEYDGAQGICPRCGVAIGFTDYDEG